MSTRQEALQTLVQFLPSAASRYAAERNFDTANPCVSKLSRFLKCRLISEEEVIQHVLAQYRLTESEKFVQEVVWRTYWKGWLERHPDLWSLYTQRVHQLKSDFAESAALHRAVEGQTNIECFDHWIRELKQTGYLHNHARMWLASIWIFTLKLPWELGADLFLTHLVDGDAAANTLSWRWVAGLQTRGKHYLATAENIHKFTKGRFFPKDQLACEVIPLTESLTFESLELPQLIHQVPEAVMKGEWTLLVHSEDLTVDLHFGAKNPPGNIILFWDSFLSRTNLVENFYAQAFQDTADRVQKQWGSNLVWAKTPSDLMEALSKKSPIVLRQPSVGWLRDELEPVLLNEPGRFVALRHPFDAAVFPFATKGFFPFKEKVFEWIPKYFNS
jgi:deoxyribodipyrimidine photo-lyase